jgi:hypothetical protein
LNLLIENIPW